MSKNIDTKKNVNYKQAGFTLVELLLVVALMAISVGVTGDVLLSLIRSYNKTGAINEVEQNANFVALKIEKELRNATNVTVNTAGTKISFEFNNQTIYYNVANNNLYRSTTNPNSTDANDALVTTPAIVGSTASNSGVNLTCDVKCFDVTGSAPQIVNISMVYSQASTAQVFKGQVNVKNTVVIRNTY